MALRGTQVTIFHTLPRKPSPNSADNDWSASVTTLIRYPWLTQARTANRRLVGSPRRLHAGQRQIARITSADYFC